MDIIRRNTDYALRAMVNLAENYSEEPVSVRTISQQEDISYQLACKLMQKLHNAKLLESMMGPKGGFRLKREPSKINLLEVIEAIQGPLNFNRCLLSENACGRKKNCPITGRLAELQGQVGDYLSSVTLNQVVEENNGKRKLRPRK